VLRHREQLGVRFRHRVLQRFLLVRQVAVVALDLRALLAQTLVLRGLFLERVAVRAIALTCAAEQRECEPEARETDSVIAEAHRCRPLKVRLSETVVARRSKSNRPERLEWRERCFAARAARLTPAAKR
jgi:hypothetical protein